MKILWKGVSFYLTYLLQGVLFGFFCISLIFNILIGVIAAFSYLLTILIHILYEEVIYIREHEREDEIKKMNENIEENLYNDLD